MRSNNTHSFSRTVSLPFSRSFLSFFLIWRIHKASHVLLPPYHTVAFLLLFPFNLGKSWWVLYVFTNSFILQKTQFASYPSLLLCYVTVVLILDLWLRVSFSNHGLRKLSPKQCMFASCRGQWNVTMVLPSLYKG